ncbi:transposable element Tcb1 transposase [Trichonephila clavipes]|nr:transposable element Tcb1 transposase [Trichonephila clavipes]
MPPHVFNLKVGAMIMLLRNLNPSAGLCKETRLIIRKMMANVIDDEISTGHTKGSHAFFSRIKLRPPDSNLLFQLQKKSIGSKTRQKWLPTWLPRMMPTWLYRRNFAMFSLILRYNARDVSRRMDAGGSIVDNCKISYKIELKNYDCRSYKKIGSRVGRNQTTVMRICDRWWQEGATDRRGRSYPPECTTSSEYTQILRMTVTDRSITLRTIEQHIESVTHHSVIARTIEAFYSNVVCPRIWVAEGYEVVFTDESRICLQHYDGRIRVWRHRGERMLNSCVLHATLVLHRVLLYGGGIRYHSHTPLVRVAGTLNSQRYISESLEPVVLPYLQGFATAIFQLDNARPHVARIVQRFYVNHQIELLPWPTRTPDLSPIENMWSMFAQRLTQITPPAATLDQLWQRVEAAWSAVPQKHIQCLFESMPRRVAVVISNNSGYSG